MVYPQLMAADGAVQILKRPEIKTADRAEIVARCTSCKCERQFTKYQIKHPLHLLATLLTRGFWLIPWLAIRIDGALRLRRCKECGWHKPEFRRSLKDILRMGEAALIRGRRQSAIRMLQRDYDALISSNASSSSEIISRSAKSLSLIHILGGADRVCSR